jgi:transcriptional regulator with XRE-family HTH domain
MLAAKIEKEPLTLHKAIENLPWNKRLEVLRIAFGLTQTEAAELCGTTQKVYWLWESGKSYPRNNSRKAITTAFGVKMDEIFPAS